MGIGATFAEAFSKAQLGAGDVLPSQGVAFLSVREFDKKRVVLLARELLDLGFSLTATDGTAKVIADAGLDVVQVNKMNQARPNIVDRIKNDEIALIINTTEGKKAIRDSADIRRSAEAHSVYYTTTLAGGEAVCMAMRFGKEKQVRRLQELHAL